MSGLAAFTLFHVVLSLVGIAAGFVVLQGFRRGKQHAGWTTLFLVTTIATSVTGFGFPFVRLLPAHIIGVASLVVLAVALFARYARHLAGRWRRPYALSGAVAQYLNVFVLVAQVFRRVPQLHALAPTESELPFFIAQVVVLVLFVLFARPAIRGFRAAHVPSAHAVGAPQV
jgi:hypothetical protein